MSLMLKAIRRGETFMLPVKRSQRRRLWEWCRRHSTHPYSTVIVRRRGDNHLPYSALHKKMSTAFPVILVHPVLNEDQKSFRIGRSEIIWSRVD